MKIGIMVYSRTGHTLSVARELEKKLSADGHQAALEQIETAGPVSPGATSVTLRTKPAVDAYQQLVIACPVQGGLPAVPMLAYLEQLASLEGKQVALLVTGFFPEKWGRSQTLARLKEMCESKGAAVRGSASVGWFSLARRSQIASAVNSLSALFG